MGAHSDARGPLEYGGLDQFGLTGEAEGMSFCVSGNDPYALDLDTDKNVICLLLGRIDARSAFEDDRECDFSFLGDSVAFHPRDGHIRVKAGDRHGGFIAFGFTNVFEEQTDHCASVGDDIGHSKNNIQNNQIKHLARYARSLIKGRRRLDPLEIQCLGSLVYMETTRLLRESQVARSTTFSDRHLRQIEAYIQEEMENPITCPQLASVVQLPMRVMFDGMKAKTGMTPYRFVLELRTERACDLLKSTKLPISEIAYTCGFSSQQHLTTTVSRLRGLSPARLREREG